MRRIQLNPYFSFALIIIFCAGAGWLILNAATQAEKSTVTYYASMDGVAPAAPL